MGGLWSQEAEGSEEVLTRDKLEEYNMATMFDEQQISKLWKEFCSMGADEEGTIEKRRALDFGVMNVHPLKERILGVLEGPARLDFTGFLKALSIFAESTPKDDKAHFAFRLWDADHDGLLSRDDLASTISIIVGSSLTASQVENVVDAVLRENSLYEDCAAIDYDAFNKMTLDGDIHRKFTPPI
eukprot:TRINITY_DN5758_c0_g1_i1.p1 TRINITY_DN5758_c0_g1~~TRINITY_DN5758_c0_g1_i1.p1  ORF type:complete len:185 (+),score=49.28 TRINITY_DN5758_c0_g1_i1:315-869(+)